MAASLVGSRELTWRLFRRDFSARYRQSLLGYVWAVAPTLLTVLAFAYLNRAKILPIGPTELPYPLFAVIGLTVWQVFASGLLKTTQSVAAAGGLIVKINFAQESLVLAAFLESLFDGLVRTLLVVALFAWYGVAPAWTVVFVPLLLVPLAMFTLGLGFVLSIANAVFRDFASGVLLVLTFAMFLAPVVYPPPSAWPHVLVNYLNPASPFLIATRDLVSGGGLSNPASLLIASVAGGLMFVCGWRVFRLAMPRIAERV